MTFTRVLLNWREKKSNAQISNFTQQENSMEIGEEGYKIQLINVCSSIKIDVKAKQEEKLTH